jgi:hypothetical protein
LKVSRSRLDKLLNLNVKPLRTNEKTIKHKRKKKEADKEFVKCGARGIIISKHETILSHATKLLILVGRRRDCYKSIVITLAIC